MYLSRHFNETHGVNQLKIADLVMGSSFLRPNGGESASVQIDLEIIESLLQIPAVAFHD